MRRRILVISTLVLIIIALLVFVVLHKKDQKTDTNTTVASTSAKQAADKTTIRFIAAGDMLAHDSVNAQAKTATGYDYTPFFTEVKPYFQKADIRFCNHEGLASGEQFGITGYPSFNAPQQYAKDLNTVGCNLINVANNHINDKGQQAINATLDVWKPLDKLAIAGANRSASEQTPQYFTVKGVKFALIAFAQYSNNTNLTPYGVNIYSESLAATQLAEAKKNAQVLIVSMHWGTEYTDTADAFQLKSAKFLADSGANIVVGTGPHVLQPATKLPKGGGGETLVWYSLGNMLGTQLDINSLIGGFAVMDFKVAGSSATLDKIGFLPTYMHYEWTPEQKAKDDLLARHNLKIYPLDQAEAPMARSLNNSSVQAQTARVTEVLNRYTPITMYTSKTY